MGMLNNSKDLVKACADALESDKELSVFPALSFAGVVLVTAVFAAVLYLTGAVDRLNGGGLGAMDYVLLLLYYFLTYFVTTFSTAALVCTAMLGMSGGNRTWKDGLRTAGPHAAAILGYSAVSATAGLVLGLLSNRGGTTGRRGSAAPSAGWNILTFLAIPILVMEGAGPVRSQRLSAALLRRTWGDKLIDTGGIGLIFGLIIAFVILLGAAFGAVVAETASPATVAMVVGITGLVVAVVGLISASLAGIYRAALYSYAITGAVGHLFREDLIKGAFSAKPERPPSFVGKV
jgi:hypothetical protein